MARKPIFIVVVFVFFVLLVSVHGQNASIVGVVTDPTGGILPGAEVSAIQEGTGMRRTAVTDGEGRYRIVSLRPSAYRVMAEVPGFRRYETRLSLLADQVLTLNVQLQVGEITDSVVVESPVVQVDTQTATLSQVIEEERMVELPLEGRNAAELTLLVAGAVRAPNKGVKFGPDKSFPSTQVISTNGAFQNQISYNFDGGSGMDSYTKVHQPFPIPDALQEFSVQTSNYSAEFGQNAGAVVNVVTKQGTSEWHGSAFGFHRNKALNARNFFAPEKDPLKRTQFGLTAGGPVPFSNDLFIFGAWQSTRIRTEAAAATAFVPTDANREGDFSAFLDPDHPENPLGRREVIFDPDTGEPFPNNVIPVDRMDPAIRNLLDYIPRAGGNGRIIFPRPLADDLDEVTIRLDKVLSGGDEITGRYFFDEFRSAEIFDPQNILTTKESSTIRSQNILLSHTRVVSPDLLNQVSVSWARVLSERIQPSASPEPAELGVNFPRDSLDQGIADFSVSGFFSIQGEPLQKIPRENFNVKDNVRWTVGAHSLSFGGELFFGRVNFRDSPAISGNYQFSADTTGNALSSMFLGKMRRVIITGQTSADMRGFFPRLYIQDHWQVTSRLSLGLGLSWDPSIPWSENNNKIQQFRIDAYASGERSQVFPNAPPGLFFFGDSGVPVNGTKSDYNNFAPRLGFAYDISGSSRTVIRGGAGIFYDAQIVSRRLQAGVNNQPFASRFDVFDPPGPFSDPLRGQPPEATEVLSTPFPPPSDATFLLPDAKFFDPGKKFVTPLLYNWNLTLEHRLTSSLLARGAYVGSHGSQMTESIELNNAIYIPGSDLGTDARRRFQGLRELSMMSNAVNSSYNSLQLTLEKRPAGGTYGGAMGAFLDQLTFLANYTFSKSIDTLGLESNLSDVRAFGGPAPFDDPRRVEFNTGPSEFDHTHRFTMSYVMNLPDLTNLANGWVRQVFGGWQWTGIFTAQSGSPITIRAGRDQSRTGLGDDRALFLGTADELGAGSRGPGGCRTDENFCVDFLDPSQFGLPEVGQFGNVGKGAFRGPSFWTYDMGFFKNFHFGETIRMQFRWEYFNVFNKTNFNNPNTNFSAGGFGGIRSAGDPRIAQVALKLMF